jgi:hypothetical protein
MIKLKQKLLWLTRIKIPIDLDDLFILVGTSLSVYGLWGFDPRIAWIMLGVWLIFLGRPRGGAE